MNELEQILAAEPEQLPVEHDGEEEMDLESRIFDSTPIDMDSRSSYRYPTMHGQETAVLRRRGRITKAELLEESAGGFRICVKGDFRAQPQERLQLGVHSGWYEVRVVHMQVADDMMELGLERTGLVAAKRPRRTQGENVVKPNVGTSFGWLGSLLVTIVVGGLSIAATVMLMTGGNPMSLFQPGVEQPTDDKQAAIPEEFAKRPPNPQLANLLGSVNVLTDEAVAKKLALSPTQGKQIKTIFVKTSQQLETAYQQADKGRSPDWKPQSQAIVNKAVEQVLGVLSEEQIGQWQQILLERQQ